MAGTWVRDQFNSGVRLTKSFSDLTSKERVFRVGHLSTASLQCGIASSSSSAQRCRRDEQQLYRQLLETPDRVLTDSERQLSMIPTLCVFCTSAVSSVLPTRIYSPMQWQCVPPVDFKCSQSAFIHYSTSSGYHIRSALVRFARRSEMARRVCRAKPKKRQA